MQIVKAFSASSEILKDSIDVLREILFDNDPVLVGITMLVSTLHSIFEILAIKNGI